MANFRNEAVLNKLVVNITWFKLSGFTGRTMNIQSFSKAELDLVLKFINQNRLNFPGQFFSKETDVRNQEIVLREELSNTILPHYFILSADQDVYSAWPHYDQMKIILINDTYTDAVDYLLGFAIAGRIEIYKEARQ